MTGCAKTSEDSSPSAVASHAPSIQMVKLSPDHPTLATPVTVIVDATDPDRHPLTFKYQWTVNDRPLTGETGHELSPARLRRGDRVKVVVVALDGVTESAPVEAAPLTIGNTPPVVSVAAIEPGNIHAGEMVTAKVEAADADQDDVTVFYRWRRNGETFKESVEPTLEMRDLKTGDLLQVEAIPRDSETTGKAMVSAPVVIGKPLPKIQSLPPTGMTDGRYEYAVHASGAEDETLRFRLEAGPPGMIIDPATGRLVWQATKEQIGLHRVKVVVQDGAGGTAFQEFELTVPPATPPKSGGA